MTGKPEKEEGAMTLYVRGKRTCACHKKVGGNR